MTGRPEPLPIEALLAQEHALRSLARRLLWDEHDAEDAAQHSLAQALARPPARRQSLAAYLTTILRNRVRDLGRVARARRDREQRAARDEALPSAAEMAEREQTRRALAEAVFGLQEPYRTTVWLRFYEDLPPGELARRLDVPVNTVRTRLQRAIQQLRAILDQRHLARDDWRAAIAPLAAWPARLPITSSVLGSVLMKKSLSMTAAAVVLVAAAVLWLDPFATTSAQPPDAVVGVGTEPVREATTRPQALPAALPVAARSPAPPPAASGSSSWRLEGVVQDTGGTPVRGARVAVAAVGGSHREACGRVVCDQDGRYAVDLSAWRERPPLDRRVLHLEVSAWAPGHLPASAEPVAFVAAAADQSMVLRRDVTLVTGALLAGRVVDAAGLGVADAHVRLCLAGKEENGAEARTGPDGTYVLGIGRAGAHVLVAWRADVGWAREERLVPTPEQDLTAPDLVLTAAAILRGQFVYDDGQPIAGLDVSAQWDSPGTSAAESQPAPTARGCRNAEGRTGADGRFEFRCLVPGRYQVPYPDAWTRADEFVLLETGPLEHRVPVALHRFRVRHEDEQGRRLVPLSLGMRGWLGRDPTQTGTVEAEPELFVAGWFDDGVFVPRGTRACFSAKEGAYRGENWVTAPERPNETDVVVTLREAPLTARLRIELVPPPGTRAPEFAMTLRKPASDTDAHVALLRETDGARTFEAEPGRFELTVFPGTGDRRADHWFPIEREVVLEEGQELVVRADAVAGGYARFTVHLPGGERVPAIPGLKVTAPHAPGEQPRRAGKFTVHDQAADSWITMGRAPSETPFRWERLLLPGAHDVTVTATGFRSITLPAVIRAGEVTDLELWLVP